MNWPMKIFLTIFAVLVSSWASACQPILDKEDKTLKGQIEKSFRVNQFIGYALVTKSEIQDNEVNYHFRVLGSFKGNLEEFETGWHPICCTCAKGFKEGYVYILHAQKYEDSWSVWEFGPTKELIQMSAKELDYIERLSEKK